MSDPAVPPGWPAEVRPPGSPDWERSAVAWMLDLCPPDYRAEEVLRRHPRVLARFATHHLTGGMAAARAGISTARAELRDLVDPDTVEAAIVAYQRQGARLESAARSLSLVERALRGGRFRPRL